MPLRPIGKIPCFSYNVSLRLGVYLRVGHPKHGWGPGSQTEKETHGDATNLKSKWGRWREGTGWMLVKAQRIEISKAGVLTQACNSYILQGEAGGLP